MEGKELAQIKKRLDSLSRKNRVFTDNLINLIACEIKSKLRYDETWYDCQLPYYVGQYKGEIQISAKASCDFKTPKEVLNSKDLQFFSEFIKEKKIKHNVVMRDFLGEVFNDSTTSSLN